MKVTFRSVKSFSGSRRIDGGTFRAIGNEPSTKMVTGSYSYKDDLKKLDIEPPGLTV